MIDLHCHILPGLDDGPGTLEESVDMCRIAARDGITTIVATPHFKPGSCEHTSRSIDDSIDALRAALRKQDIAIKILPGADVSVTPELPLHLEAFDYLTINKNRKYFLAEFPADFVPPRWDAFLLTILRSGIVPIITHPERNRWFLGHCSALSAFVRSGGLVQVTAMSVAGQFGDEIREFCGFLLSRGLAHVIATDAHSCEGRAPLLSEAVLAAGRIIGKDEADALVTTVPEAIIQGMAVRVPPPVIQPAIPKRKTWMRRLTS